MKSVATNPPALPAPNKGSIQTVVLPAPAASTTGLAHTVSGGDWPEPALQLGWRIVLTLLLLLLVAVFSILLQPARAAKAASPAQGVSDPLVLAFYYSWFDDNTWNSGQLSDLPAERYVSADRAAMGRHIDQAKAAGIDALLVAWYGPYGDSNQTETNLQALLDEAAARSFRIGILFETDSPFLGGAGDVTAALQQALSTHANHPAYLRVDGKPVIFFWRSSLYDAGTWAAMRSQADPGSSSLWIGEGVDTSQLSVFDGHYLYSNTWNPPADLNATNQKFAGRVEAMRNATASPKLWVATVMPGYNDVGVRPNSGFVRGRDGGAYYAQSWQAAIASNPNWVVITSFNEWPEGTYIEPSAAYGDAYLGLTAQYSSQFKAGGGAAWVAAAGPEADAESAVETAVETAAETSLDDTAAAVTPGEPAADTIDDPAAPTVFVQTAVLNLRAGPGTDYPLVGAVVEGDALVIVGQSAADNAAEGDFRWWQVDTIAGSAWLFGEHVRAAGALELVPQIDVAPAVALAVLPAATPNVQIAGIPTTTLTINGVSITLRNGRSIP